MDCDSGDFDDLAWISMILVILVISHGFLRFGVDFHDSLWIFVILVIFRDLGLVFIAFLRFGMDFH